MGIILWIYIQRIWKSKYSGFNGDMNLSTLNTANAMGAALPNDSGFWSMKWTIIRHAIITIISAALVWYVNLGWLGTMLIGINSLYVFLKIPLHSSRKKFFGSSSSTLQHELKSVYRITVLVFGYCCYLLALLYLLYIFR